MSLASVIAALRRSFRRTRRLPRIEGEAVAREQAPALWKRLEELAGLVGTAAPRNLIAGIDDNFFVTQSAVRLGERVLEGRTLFVSLPLLRMLSSSEADAVLAHELAHLRGAARWKNKRRRELEADRVAAAVTTRGDLCRALLKTTAYSSQRARTEAELFERREQHREALELERRVAEGLQTYAKSAQFQRDVSQARVPHPFDSHPSLAERLRAQSSLLSAADCAPPASTWLDLFPGALGLEQRLWAAYEQRFVEAHERSLAYRYLPENDAQRAVVERSFPEQTFRLESGATLRINHAGITLGDAGEIRFAELRAAHVGGVLVLEHGRGSTRLEVSSELEATFSDYWHRHRLAHELSPRGEDVRR